MRRARITNAGGCSPLGATPIRVFPASKVRHKEFTSSLTRSQLACSLRRDAILLELSLAGAAEQPARAEPLLRPLALWQLRSASIQPYESAQLRLEHLARESPHSLMRVAHLKVCGRLVRENVCLKTRRDAKPKEEVVADQLGEGQVRVLSVGLCYALERRDGVQLGVRRAAFPTHKARDRM